MEKDFVESQLSELYSILDCQPISANAISIYVVLLQVARLVGRDDELRVPNTKLISNVKGLSLSALQRARNELINSNLILYKKGTNQNETPIYTIIKLKDNRQAGYRIEQPNEQPNKQADEQADEHILTKLNLLYKYINKGESRSRNSDFLKKIEDH